MPTTPPPQMPWEDPTTINNQVPGAPDDPPDFDIDFSSDTPPPSDEDSSGPDSDSLAEHTTYDNVTDPEVDLPVSNEEMIGLAAQQENPNFQPGSPVTSDTHVYFLPDDPPADSEGTEHDLTDSRFPDLDDPADGETLPGENPRNDGKDELPEDEIDDFKSDSDEPLERKPKEVESQSKNENGGGEAQPDEGQVQTDGESNDGKAEVEPDEPGDGSLEKSATDSVENYAANTEQDKIEPAKGDQPDKWSDAFIIYTAIMMITAMTLLDGFGDENGARFGSGSAKLGRIADQLPAASAHHGWQGLAAEAYDAQNTGLRELITQMAEADKRIQHLVQDHADQITHTRIALGTSIGFLTVCALVAEALQRLGLLSLSLKYQILVCTPVLITCATMQAVLVEHSQQTASSIREATHRYQRVSASPAPHRRPGTGSTPP
ncbi:hypothetical protein MSHI_30850 [Mycobacterium shinjukuense]|uniref:ESX-1 secretion-associated protein EspA/EspE-like domain-containing protein n=1 Tax=Mycobacterium shinjukuense TaxID=398694 RepID=A0A7I7MVE5_9MYCO|nr:EspA/EspE family type VII secretion system effector [Mycobacterium shinjukuense]BBX75179.1 hypothetical protein MSHI_30850 [Mycobacterium shinjukuense]